MKNAEFLAATEYLGLTSWYLARRLDVKEMDIRYQMFGDVPVSAEAGHLVASLLAEFAAQVDKALARLDAAPAGAALRVAVPYYRNQREFEEGTGTDIYFKYANSRSREVARLCEERGARVEYAYPDDANYDPVLKLL